mmetsp:Transcript_20070/g.41354  ORF Transcript_20070/g.41354 Transcript_20070/m.41354 type:complete len:224 (+) Transcript_20070:441-1112(+)
MFRQTVYKALSFSISFDRELLIAFSSRFHRSQQVIKVFVVNLKEGGTQGKVPFLFHHGFCLLEDLANRTGNDSSHWSISATLHSMGLPRTCLPIRKQANMVPIQSTLYEIRNLVEYKFLPSRRRKNFVKFVVQWIPTASINNGKRFSIRGDIDWRIVSLVVTGQKWPSTNVNSNVTSQLLNGIVHFSTNLLALEQFIFQIINALITFFNTRTKHGIIFHFVRV